MHICTATGQILYVYMCVKIDEPSVLSSMLITFGSLHILLQTGRISSVHKCLSITWANNRKERAIPFVYKRPKTSTKQSEDKVYVHTSSFICFCVHELGFLVRWPRRTTMKDFINNTGDEKQSSLLFTLSTRRENTMLCRRNLNGS